MIDFRFECIELDVQTPTESFGRFVFKPLDLGEGTTVGNMLRRVLLSGLSGLRITGMRIAGVNNEFASIQGVREDILEIILNLKEIIFKSNNNKSGYGRLKVQGPAIITAKTFELSGDIEIINPFNHLFTISDDSIVELEIKLEWGKSYTLAENQKLEDSSDFFPIDSNFMPVQKMNFYTKPLSSSLEDKKEQVFLDIWTNGTITPQESVSQAASILLAWLEPIRKIQGLTNNSLKEKTEEKIIKTPQEKIRKVPIEELNLSTRAYKSLKTANINFVEDLIQYPLSELKKLKNFGRKSLEELVKKLNKLYKVSFEEI